MRWAGPAACSRWCCCAAPCCRPPQRRSDECSAQCDDGATPGGAGKEADREREREKGLLVLCTFLAGISYLHLFLLVGGLVLAQLNDHLVALIIDLGFGFLFLWLGRLGRILPHNGMPTTRAKQWGRGEVYEKETTSVSTSTVHAGIRGKHAGYQSINQSLSLGGETELTLWWRHWLGHPHHN